MQKPSIGRVVIVPREPATNNGAAEAPAVISRVWPERPDGTCLINVRVLEDNSATPTWLTSLGLHEDEDTARAHGNHVAWWPPRI